MALLYFLAGILIPLVIAFVLVVLVDAVVTFINARWPGAPKWVVSAVAGLVVILSASGGMFVLAQGAVQVVQQGPALLDRIDVLVRNTSQSLHLKEPLGLQALVGSINIPHLAGAPALHFLFQPGVSDNKFSIVQHVVTDQAVQELRQ